MVAPVGLEPTLYDVRSVGDFPVADGALNGRDGWNRTNSMSWFQTRRLTFCPHPGKWSGWVELEPPPQVSQTWMPAFTLHPDGQKPRNRTGSTSVRGSEATTTPVSDGENSR